MGVIESCSSEVEVEKLIQSTLARDINFDLIMNMAKNNLSFAVHIMHKIGSLRVHLVPANHLARIISQQKSKDLFRYLPKKINDFENNDKVMLWYCARLIVIGVFEGEIETLYQIVNRIDINHIPTMQFVNSLLTLAYEARHLQSGLVLADHFWRGIGLLQSRELAIEIYQDIARNDSTVLTVDAVSRLSQHCIVQACKSYQKYNEILEQIQTLKTVIVQSESTSDLTKIKSAVGCFSYGYLRHIQFRPNAKCQELEREAKNALAAAIDQLNYIVEIDVCQQTELINHVGCLTAHIMLFQIITEQHEAIPKSQALKVCARSLRAAWHYDTLPGAVEELKNYLIRYKQLSRGSMEDVIRSINFDLLTQIHLGRFFNTKPTLEQDKMGQLNCEKPSKLTRSSSMPILKQ